jgi:hypothetical protein
MSGFTCAHCGATSAHPDDAVNRYCGRCHHFCDDVRVCGVTGDFAPDPLAALSGHREPFAPCAELGTELARSICERGHERKRWVCPPHLDILMRPPAGGQVYCLVCWETEGIESVLTPLTPHPGP